ncbi:MAG: hypothetical protein ACE5G9_02315 [Nitrospinales bacterium]
MLTEDNLVLNRAEPNGLGGLQFLYRVRDYGVSATSPPTESMTQIRWEVDVIRYHDTKTLNYELCHTTELADKTLIFHNDKSLNEFLLKAFGYFKEISLLEGMM